MRFARCKLPVTYIFISILFIVCVGCAKPIQQEAPLTDHRFGFPSVTGLWLLEYMDFVPYTPKERRDPVIERLISHCESAQMNDCTYHVVPGKKLRTVARGSASSFYVAVEIEGLIPSQKYTFAFNILNPYGVLEGGLVGKIYAQPEPMSDIPVQVFFETEKLDWIIGTWKINIYINGNIAGNGFIHVRE